MKSVLKLHKWFFASFSRSSPKTDIIWSLFHQHKAIDNAFCTDQIIWFLPNQGMCWLHTLNYKIFALGQTTFLQHKRHPNVGPICWTNSQDAASSKNFMVPHIHSKAYIGRHCRKFNIHTDTRLSVCFVLGIQFLQERKFQQVPFWR